MLIEDIREPGDLKNLSSAELKELSGELREIIIKAVSENGGHLASNLGAVELSIALHYAFDAPRDRIIWDVGHQAYTHKLLTGRYGRFSTLRKAGGLSGFPKRNESPYDAFGVGHSSTSISAATGIIEARDWAGEKFKVIAVIGDGALTAGLAFEGLNHAGQLKKDLIVVLNDNEMSISKNVGALSAYLNRILTGERYRKFKKETRQIIESIPRFGGKMSRLAQKAEESLKGLFLPGVLFEELGFEYVGPIDGHDIDGLIQTFNKIKSYRNPVLVHVVTKKGKGYEFSEKDPCGFHGIGPFEPETGSPLSNSVTYCDLFGRTLAELADKDPRVVAITAAMKEGTGLGPFADKYPGRFYDVGIAEPHAVTFAAGLAVGGMRPVVAIYSTFLQRAYDEIVHDVCLQRLPVVFAIDRAGIVGEDGPTHQGAFDISYLRHIPNLTVMAPKDAAELKAMLGLALTLEGPSSIRYPRGKAHEFGDGPHGGPGDDAVEALQPGKGEVLKDGKDLVLMAIGNTAHAALGAAKGLEAEGISAMVLNMRFIKPLDENLLRAASGVGRIITIEENAISGGFGSAVLECIAGMGLSVEIGMLGLPDNFIEQGTQKELRKKYGLDEEGIKKAALRFLKEKPQNIMRPII